ncbi:hypothetical protein JTB14_035205 [Gonioctena quinquepunctata]|nr:hypothetical protein JTB14_035205 [Gonioctena quinquepunctata]
MRLYGRRYIRPVAICLNNKAAIMALGFDRITSKMANIRTKNLMCMPGNLSTSGVVLVFARTSISFYATGQSMVSLSTAEVDYIAATEAIKKTIIMGEELGIR